ncbi:HAMP domain-containing sensor histidine kinase [Planotetraspora phitsanulokensis]|uniref:histidine kinase n=1 Tax=Planotetraspora phitsanulokensis TaxID=575192 RepID=A0A8J3UBL3_9ACTN|nr:HAMP domain-containing sensor histidine kinase [Planotetraspora phitsanulokensis]GII41576.1 two-component sensor histidine kinase [Planotetraspora phitsanulokensis]
MLFLGVAVALLSTLMSGMVIFIVHRLATESRTATVTGMATEVASLVSRGELRNPISDQVIPYVQVLDSQRRVVASTENLRGRPPIASFLPANTESERTEVICGKAIPSGDCAMVVAVQATDNGKLWTIYGAAPPVPFYVDPLLALLLVAGTVIIVGLIIFASYRIIVGYIEPVRLIRAELGHLRPTRLSERVLVPSRSHREAHDLATAVNRTLDQLQAMMERERQFTFDISHDLRNPITAMRTEIEDVLLAPDEVDVARLGTTLLAGLDRLQAIVSDLLMLAKLDAGAPTTCREVDLAELATAECARRSGKQIICEVTPGTVVKGDPVRLARLVNNLVANAERHASSQVTVRVSRQGGDTGSGAGTAVLEVIDDGEGIAPGDREAVFERFVRLEAGRRKESGGTGLGLPIARQIAESHSGTLTIQDSDRGAHFVLRMPLGSGDGDTES